MIGQLRIDQSNGLLWTYKSLSALGHTNFPFEILRLFHIWSCSLCWNWPWNCIGNKNKLKRHWTMLYSMVINMLSDDHWPWPYAYCLSTDSILRISLLWRINWQNVKNAVILSILLSLCVGMKKRFELNKLEKENIFGKRILFLRITSIINLFHFVYSATPTKYLYFIPFVFGKEFLFYWIQIKWVQYSEFR